MIGTQLSHFKITAKLGEGGMGEFYSAEDTKLGREVAIKVLPEAFTNDSERLARFKRSSRGVLLALVQPIPGPLPPPPRFLVLLREIAPPYSLRQAGTGWKGLVFLDTCPRQE